MRKYIAVFVILFLIGFHSHGQTKYLYATCWFGGSNGSGTILAANDTGGNFHTVYNFIDSIGAAPMGRMVQALDGKLYGCTYYGGYADSCCLFRYDPVIDSYTLCHQFFLTQQYGAQPFSGLTLDTSGILYGVTASGGAYSNGVIYSFDPNTLTYNDIYDVGDTGVNGQPVAELVQSANGTLYGTTTAFNSGINGSIFSFTPSINKFINLYNLGAADGQPVSTARLIIATDGKCYGTTIYGGAYQLGIIYSFDTNTHVFTHLYDFTEGTGSPVNGLIQTKDSLLYGATAGDTLNGRGIIYTFNIYTGLFNQVLHLDHSTGSYIQRAFTEVGGKLFGAAQGDGTNNFGTFFKLDEASQTFTKILDLDSASLGGAPNCEIVEINVCNPLLSQVNASICDGTGYQLGNQFYYSAGIYDVAFESPSACSDSIIQLTLNVDSSPALNQLTASICNGANYQFAGQTLFTAGVYTDTLVSTSGCDSVVQLTLTIYQLPMVTLTLPSTSLCLGQSLTLTGGSPFGGVYAGNDVSGGIFTPTQAGADTIFYTYTDSLSQCGNSNQAVVITSLCNGIAPLKWKEDRLQIYPQPANGTLNIVSKLADQGLVALSIYDITGRLVPAPWERDGGKIGVDISSLAAGAYVLTLQSGTAVASGRFMVK